MTLTGFDLNNTRNQTITQSLGGSGSFVWYCGQTITLNGINSYSGNTTIYSGNLTLGGSGQLGSGNYSGIISLGGSVTLTQNSSANQIYSGSITGSGANFIQSGTGTTTFSGSISYSGNTTISNGVLSFSSGTLNTTSSITMSGGTLQWNGVNTQDLSSKIIMINSTSSVFDTNSNNITFAAAIGGSTSAKFG